MGLTHGVDPTSAPIPGNADEELVFGLLYETLVRMDCRGEAVGGLATEWQATEDGRRWILSLRPDARFWNGEPVTAASVVTAWAAGRKGGGSTRLASVEALDRSRIAVVPTSPTLEVPAILAEPAFAVADRRPGRWPVGTGAYRIPAEDSAGASGAAAPRGDGTVLRSSEPALPATIRLRRSDGGDPRDLLDGGADVLVSRDPSVIAYGAARGLEALPLPWDRTYVLVTPARRWADPAPDDTAGLGQLRADLARDAVRGSARGARAAPLECRPEATGTPETLESPDGGRVGGRDLGQVTGRILYDRDDATARELAERLAALAGFPTGRGDQGTLPRGLAAAMGVTTGGRVSAQPAGTDEMERAFAEGDAAAFVLFRPGAEGPACSWIRERGAAARWLGSGGSLAASSLELVETRAHLLTPPGVPWVAGPGGVPRLPTPVGGGRE